MSDVSYIEDNKLPLSQSFKGLKAEAMAFIQEHSGPEWTNFNPSDPGVTILDQLCYALTELGYCGEFSMEDILTTEDDKLSIKDQFYLPRQILTTASITIDDYRKYIIDAFSEVINVIIEPVTIGHNNKGNLYATYLYVNDSVQDSDALCNEVFFKLNRSRNVAEFFLIPSLLKQKHLRLEGEIEIAKPQNLVSFLSILKEQIDSYVFSSVPQVGFNQLLEEGLETNSIFNGPNLRQGWITTKALGTKRDQINTNEIEELILQQSDAVSSKSLKFKYTKGLKSFGSRNSVSASLDQLLVFDVLTSFYLGELKICCNGEVLNNKYNQKEKDLLLPKSNNATKDILISAVNMEPSIPTGKFRDIANYYSIQNTFPSIYGVGEEGYRSGSSNQSAAQVNQLKGYLILYDQVIANQFSQLSNVGKLFSFENASTGSPTTTAAYYKVKNDFERKHLKDPVPFQVFSPTYYYKDLYEVPNIGPLLKDYDKYYSLTEQDSPRESYKKSWTNYKLAPYNPYIKGLMDFLENEQVSLERRNKMLDHLLARHGESPLLIDCFIEGSYYTKDPNKDRIIYKSIYLQNLEFITYNRMKAYNYVGADTLSSIFLKRKEFVNKVEAIRKKTYETDFIFDSEEVNRSTAINAQDIQNYSGVELKLNMLFGLTFLYESFVIEQYDKLNIVKSKKGSIKVKKNKLYYQFRQLFWLTEHRKGFIFLESDLLFRFLDNTLFTDKSKKINPIIDFLEEHFFNKVHFFFPAYVDGIDTMPFRNKLDVFLENSLAVQVEYKYHFLNTLEMELLILSYTAFHNDLKNHFNKKTHNLFPYTSTKILAETLYEILNK